MFPGVSTMYLSLFSDEALYLETANKAAFWQYPSFFGVDMTCLHDAAWREPFNQPSVEQIDPACLVGEPTTKRFDFVTMEAGELSLVRTLLGLICTIVSDPPRLSWVLCFADEGRDAVDVRLRRGGCASLTTAIPAFADRSAHSDNCGTSAVYPRHCLLV